MLRSYQALDLTLMELGLRVLELGHSWSLTLVAGFPHIVPQVWFSDTAISNLRAGMWSDANTTEILSIASLAFHRSAFFGAPPA